MGLLMNKLVIKNDRQIKSICPNEILNSFSKDELFGVNCLLINMPIREQALPNNAPLGLSILAAQLLKYGAHVEILDLNSYRIKDSVSQSKKLSNGRVLNTREAEHYLESHVTAREFQLIALSGLITTLKWQKFCASFLKRISPESYLVSGGGLATEFREELFNWMPDLDAVAHSEGDSVIIKIARDARELANRSEVTPEVIKKIVSPSRYVNKNGKLYVVYDGGRPDNLDDISLPAWNLLDKDFKGNTTLENYISVPIWGKEARNSSATSFMMKRSLNTVSSRGCPFACKFCFRGAQGERNYGIRSPINLFNEMKLYKKRYNIDFLGYVDDNFAVSRKRIFELESLISEWTTENKLVWGTHARLDEAADIKSNENDKLEFNLPLRVDSMYSSGCRYIGFGAESASPRMLKKMGKGGSMLRFGVRSVYGYDVPVTMMAGIENTINAGIHANCTWIMGYPGETLEDLKATVAFIKWQEKGLRDGYLKNSTYWELASEAINKNMFVATAYPGTEMFLDPIVRDRLSQGFGIKFKNGRVICDDSLEKYVEQLNDATDLIWTPEGKVLQYSEIDDDLFLEIRKLIDEDRIYEILDL